jgi:hypothetical protein
MGARKALFFLAVLAFWAVPAAQAQEGSEPGDGGFADRDNLLTMPITPTVVIVCHGFDCLYRDEVALSAHDLGEIARLMRPAKTSAAAERAAIGKVMAWFDRRIGPEVGTAGHAAHAGAEHTGDRRQFDCIDTTHNTTLVLRELQRLKLMTHYHVAEPVSRLGPPLHSTAVIEGSPGDDWAVDGWTRGYGEAPDVMPLERWRESSVPGEPVPPGRISAGVAESGG